MFGLSTELPIWLSFFVLFIGFGYAFLLYKKEEKLDNVWLKRVLFFIRMLLISFLGYLLLNPLLKSITQDKERPIVIIAQDASSSLKDYSISQQLSDLEKDLKKEFDVFPFHFSETINPGISVNEDGMQTNFSSFFNTLESQFVNRNVVAIILASDGIYNAGKNPIYNSNSTYFPLYTIALGDTVRQKDLLIKDVKHNEVSFFGNEFPIEILLESFNCKNEIIEFKLLHDNFVLHKQSIKIDKDEFFLKVPLRVLAKKEGLQKYSLQLSTIEEEKNKANNQYDIFVDVLDSKYNILILSEHSHPDIAAFRSVIEKNKHYSVDVKKVENFSGNIKMYNLVVLFGITNQFLKDNIINNTNVSVLFFVNSFTNLMEFNKLDLGLKIKGKNTIQEVFPENNKDFPLFTISPKLNKSLENVSPLFAPFGSYNISSFAEILFSQKIGKISTKKPLLFFINVDNRKIGVFTAEGFWKWKLMEFAELKNNESFDELFSKITQYLLLYDDKSKFILKYENKLNAKTPIVFKAEFYNDSYEAVTKNEILLVIKNKDGKEYPYNFSKLDKYYYLDIGDFPPGTYSFVAKVEKTTYTKKGTFTIVPSQVENLESRANHQLLFSLSNQSGGKLYFPDQLEELRKELNNSKKNKTIIRFKDNSQKLINIQWILFTLLILICMEWFIRKYNGLQ